MISPFYVFAYSTKSTGAELEKLTTNNENNVTKTCKIPHKRRKKVGTIYGALIVYLTLRVVRYRNS